MGEIKIMAWIISIQRPRASHLASYFIQQILNYVLISLCNLIRLSNGCLNRIRFDVLMGKLLIFLLMPFQT